MSFIIQFLVKLFGAHSANKKNQTNWLEENWFKVGLLTVVLLVAVSLSYYYLFYLPQQNINWQKITPLTKEQQKAQQDTANQANIRFNQAMEEYNQCMDQMQEKIETYLTQKCPSNADISAVAEQMKCRSNAMDLPEFKQFECKSPFVN